MISSVTNLDLNQQHIQAELNRLDVLVRRAVRRWQLAGQNPADTFRGLHLSDKEVNRLLTRSFGVSWGQTVTLSDEEEKALAEAEAETARQVQTIIEQAWTQGLMTRLHYLAQAFGLSRFEYDALLVCLAPTLDQRYERLYSYLQDDVTRKRPTVDLILSLLSDSSSERLELLTYFVADAPLFKYNLLEWVAEHANPSFVSQSLRPDKTVVSWLLGCYQPQATLGTGVYLTRPSVDETDQLLVAGVWSDLEPMLESEDQPVIAFYGPDQAGQSAAARLAALKKSRMLLTVNLAKVIETGTNSLLALRMALRDARLTGAIPYLTGWDACRPNGVWAIEELVDLCNYPDLVIVAGQQVWQVEGIERERSLIWFEFSTPTYAQRLTLWQHFVNVVEPACNGHGKGRQSPSPLHLEIVAGQFALTSGQIRDVTATARDRARQRGSCLTDEDLFIAARAHSNPRLASLARKITPRYCWTDLILPEDQLEILREVVATVSGRPLVLETWGVGQKLTASKGVTILFAGSPGTGKTMAAEIIAGELGLDLYKIELSTVVSKYIGETEKNLERIFVEAQQGNAILFFDEADAIFGKRSEVKDAHDRYANLEISYLLQRMESYDGVTILATNLRANLDEAFTRRLQFAVDFPFPDERNRLHIWQTLFPSGVPRRSDLDFGLLANRFKLAGGNIRNIIVGAAYLAAADGGEVTMDHLLRSTRRELQKMGRLVSKADMTKLAVNDPLQDTKCDV